jgi:hypothetical protein
MKAILHLLYRWFGVEAHADDVYAVLIIMSVLLIIRWLFRPRTALIVALVCIAGFVGLAFVFVGDEYRYLDVRIRTTVTLCCLFAAFSIYELMIPVLRFVRPYALRALRSGISSPVAQ